LHSNRYDNKVRGNLSAILPGEEFREGEHKSIVTIILIAINVVLYLYTGFSSSPPLLESSDESIVQLGFKPIYIFTNPAEALTKVFTNMSVLLRYSTFSSTCTSCGYLDPD
jgi:hypothetical protein